MTKNVKYLRVYLQNKSVPMLTIKYFAVHNNSTNWSAALWMMHGGRRDTPGITLWFQLEDTVLLIDTLLLFDPVLLPIYET